MTIVISNYKNFTLVPAFTTQTERTISAYIGDPCLSPFSNLFIKSLSGNSSLKNAQVICLSDFHYDVVQKYIRAQIINEVLGSRNLTNKEVIFLVEGAQAGSEPHAWVHDKLIGKNLINCDHFVFGWDNMRLNKLGIYLIKSMQLLRLVGKKMERDSICLDEKRLEILHRTDISPEQMLERIDTIESEMHSVRSKAEKISNTISFILENLNKTSEYRNDYLYRSINTILENKPESIVFAIGGKFHFKHIPEEMNDVRYSVVNLKEIRKITDFDEACKEVYGEPLRFSNLQKTSSPLLSKL